MVVFVADNTDQRRAELAAVRAEDALRDISAAKPAGGVFQISHRPPSRRQLLMPFGAQARPACRRAADGILHDPARFVSLLPTTDRDDMFAAVERAINAGGVLEGRWRIKRSDGGTRWIKLSATSRRPTTGNWLFDGSSPTSPPVKEAEQESDCARARTTN